MQECSNNTTGPVRADEPWLHDDGRLAGSASRESPLQRCSVGRKGDSSLVPSASRIMGCLKLHRGPYGGVQEPSDTPDRLTQPPRVYFTLCIQTACVSVGRSDHKKTGSKLLLLVKVVVVWHTLVIRRSISLSIKRLIPLSPCNVCLRPTGGDIQQGSSSNICPISDTISLKYLKKEN